MESYAQLLAQTIFPQRKHPLWLGCLQKAQITEPVCQRNFSPSNTGAYTDRPTQLNSTTNTTELEINPLRKTFSACVLFSPNCSEVEATAGAETVMGPSRRVHKPATMWITQETDKPHQEQPSTLRGCGRKSTRGLLGHAYSVWHLPVARKVPLVQPQLPGRSASGGQKPQGCAFKYLWLFSSFNPKFSALRKPRPQSCDQFSSFSRAKPQPGGEREDTRQREESCPSPETSEMKRWHKFWKMRTITRSS